MKPFKTAIAALLAFTTAAPAMAFDHHGWKVQCKGTAADDNRACHMTRGGVWVIYGGGDNITISVFDSNEAPMTVNVRGGKRFTQTNGHIHWGSATDYVFSSLMNGHDVTLDYQGKDGAAVTRTIPGDYFNHAFRWMDMRLKDESLSG